MTRGRVATCAAVERELSDDLYCYRYRPDERALGEAEGAFVLCGFWMALALEQQGRPLQAARWFERNRAACGPPGLLSEEFDVTPAPDARQPAAGVRARAAARVRCHAARRAVSVRSVADPPTRVTRT